jgi:hypothetical protein
VTPPRRSPRGPRESEPVADSNRGGAGPSERRPDGDLSAPGPVQAARAVVHAPIHRDTACSGAVARSTALLLEPPLELLERLAALLPPPRRPRRSCRQLRVTPSRLAPRPRGRTERLPWATLLRRVFDHPINCNSHRGGGRTHPGHASLPPAVRAGARRRHAPTQLGRGSSLLP